MRVVKLLARGTGASGESRSFDCVVVRLADEHFAQDDRVILRWRSWATG